ncbi:CRISPR-associated endonuclease Cas2 [Ktedonospora formicarum]|uniref:CRISPR-associated endoribonuclease Cas2 n=1 Tax=Ktedonospora formicarum TaxID=2778364 RepID=A0A8J3MYH6_9CHLR|nr:CRISPR-associated endonuclease Cas2 [Ktedonospora formicarum]GHO49670.1 CRISPR-associated endoribonuclease Cas2 2 [Ktedonospora formicarum]
MRYLLIYDITHDGTRSKVADVCLDYGLNRIQYSAFLGELSPAHQRELLLKVHQRLGKHGANIQLFPLDEKAWVGRKSIEREERQNNE